MFCFLFFCVCSFKSFCLSGAPFLILLRTFCLSGSPFSYIYVFFRPRPKPQSRGPLCLWRSFLPKTPRFFYIFSSGAPCFVSCSFVFALLRPFCLSGALFLYMLVFSGYALSPKVGGPYVFLGGPLFCCLLKFLALLKLFCVPGPLLKHTFSPPAARFWGLKQLLKRTAPP